ELDLKVLVALLAAQEGSVRKPAGQVGSDEVTVAEGPVLHQAFPACEIVVLEKRLPAAFFCSRLCIIAGAAGPEQGLGPDKTQGQQHRCGEGTNHLHEILLGQRYLTVAHPWSGLGGRRRNGPDAKRAVGAAGDQPLAVGREGKARAPLLWPRSVAISC